MRAGVRLLLRFESLNLSSYNFVSIKICEINENARRKIESAKFSLSSTEIKCSTCVRVHMTNRNRYGVFFGQWKESMNYCRLIYIRALKPFFTRLPSVESENLFFHSQTKAKPFFFVDSLQTKWALTFVHKNILNVNYQVFKLHFKWFVAFEEAKNDFKWSLDNA